MGGRCADADRTGDACMPQIVVETAELAPRIWSVRPKGELDASNLGQLRGAFDQIFSQKVYRIVINLGAIKYLSSSAIGVIIGGFTTAVKNGGRMVLATTPPSVLEVLRLIGLGTVLIFAADEKDALQKLEKLANSKESGRKPR
jgi:anti-anti-sigma factor